VGSAGGVVTGFRIDVDARALVRQAWKDLPWRYRWVQFIPGWRERIEDQAVRALTAGNTNERGQEH
jgi:hypothetical protein